MFVGVVGTDPYDAFGVLSAAVLDEGGDFCWELWKVATDWWAFGPACLIHFVCMSRAESKSCV